MPTADNNHIINYNLKLKNYLIVNTSVHMLSAGVFTFMVRGVLGNMIDRTLLNYLGQSKSIYGLILIYGSAYYFSF